MAETTSENKKAEDRKNCVKLQLPQHLLACLEGRKLLREYPEITGDNNVVGTVMSNYVLAKQILSNLSWQDKLVCKTVCSTWLSAINILQKEQQGPEDFVMRIRKKDVENELTFISSGIFHTEPLLVMTFANTKGFNANTTCNLFTPCPCDEQCENAHCTLDFLHNHITAPKNCIFTVKANFISYLPLANTITHKFTLKQDIFLKIKPFIGGVYIPKIPNVDFQVINITSDSQINEQFKDMVNNIAATNIFKGILVFVSDKYLLHDVEDIVFLNHFKKVQPDIPYALAGCNIEDVSYGPNDLQNIIDGMNKAHEYITDNLISIGIFSIPKGIDQSATNNFDIFSLIIETKDWAKPKILQSITEFSKKVPHYEHSVVLKLSCVGRNEKHKIEQDYFRASFPNTRLIGCYGDGELGINHPMPQPTKSLSSQVKRLKNNQDYDIMYSYSTIFFYIGWGRILKLPETK